MHPEYCAPLIRQINCATEKRINNELRESDLTHAQICLSFVLIEKEEGQCSLKNLEKHLHLAQSTTLGIVRRSEEKGLVECFPDPDDRRSKSVRITQRGIDLCSKIRSDVQNTESWLLAALTPEEQEVFRSLLTKVRNSLCAE